MKKDIINFILTLVGAIGAGVFIWFTDYYSFGLQIALICLLGVLIALEIVFYALKKPMIYKLGFTVAMLALLFAGLFFLLDRIGFFETVEDIDTLREYISGFGPFAFVVYFLIQFFQVIVAPIPATVTIAVGALIFHPVVGGLISLAAITSGSVLAFLIGKKFGIKVVKWIVGEENLKKGLELIKGKDKVAISLMFLFPFFPDDVLCFVAGLSTMNLPFFVIVVVVSRIITITSTSALTSFFQWILAENLLLGIILCILGVALIVAVFYVGMKNADKLERWIEKISGKRKNKKAGKSESEGEEGKEQKGGEPGASVTDRNQDSAAQVRAFQEEPKSESADKTVRKGPEHE